MGMSHAALIGILGANSLPIFGVIFLGWNVSDLMFMYWWESVVVGIFTLCKISKNEFPIDASRRMLLWGKEKPLSRSNYLQMFSLHYGLFTAIHGLIVWVLFLRDWTWSSGVLVSMLVLGMTHGLSFVSNYLYKGEYLRVSLDQLMWAPYARVLVMQMTVLCVGMIVSVGGSTMVGLLVLSVCKLIADLAGHLFEHTAEGTYAVRPWAMKLIELVLPNYQDWLHTLFLQSYRSGTWEQMKNQMNPEQIEQVEKYYTSILNAEKS